MLSLSSQHAVGLSFQLARALSPLVRTLATSALTRQAALPQPAYYSEEEAEPAPQQFVALPRFAPHAPPAHPAPMAPFETHHTTQMFSAVLANTRSHFPEAVRAKLAHLCASPAAAAALRRQAPLVVDVAVGAEGRTGVELAKRGLRVISVSSDAQVLTRTHVCAEAANVRGLMGLVTAQQEAACMGDCAADMVTLMHGLHLLDPQEALAEAHRILKPGGKLVVAWNDRDLHHGFVDELEEVLESHLPFYCRETQQHTVLGWGATLQRGGLFRLREYSAHANPVVLRNVATLEDILNSQAYVRGALRGPDRKQLNADVAALAERRFGEGPLLLPMQTRLFVLEKALPSPRQ